MDQFFDKIHTVRKRIGMNEQEHQKMDDAVLSYMHEHPFQEKKRKDIHEKQNSSSLLGTFLANFARGFVYAALAIVIVVVGGGATTFAAEGALPGETLYGFKVNISEEVHSAFLFSERDKAQWEAQRVERRLLEIEKLIQQTGHADDRLLELVQQNITRHSKQVVISTRSLHESGDAEAILTVVNQLQGSLDTYRRLLSELVQNNAGAVDPEVQKLVENIESTQQTAKSAEFRLMLERQGIVSTDLGEKNNQENDARVQFVFPSDGESLVMGNRYSIVWNSRVNEPGSLTLELLREDNSMAGFIGVKSVQDGRIIWDPKFVFQHENDLQSEKLHSGNYKIRASFFGNSGVRFTSLSSMFHVIEPTVTSVDVKVNIYNVAGSETIPSKNALVKIFGSNGMKVDAKYSDAYGETYFRVIPGTYIISASIKGASQKAETQISVAYVRETSVDINLIMDSDKNEGISEPEMAPFQKGVEFISPNGFLNLFKDTKNKNIIRWEMLDKTLANTSSHFFLRGMDGRIADIITQDLPGLFKGTLVYNVPSTIVPGQYYIEVEAQGDVVGRSKVFTILDGDLPKTAINIQVEQEKTYYVTETEQETVISEFFVSPSAPTTLKNVRISCGEDNDKISQMRIVHVEGKLNMTIAQDDESSRVFRNVNDPISGKVAYRVFARIKKDTLPQTIHCGISHVYDISFGDEGEKTQMKTYHVQMDVGSMSSVQIVKRSLGASPSLKILSPRRDNFYKIGRTLSIDWKFTLSGGDDRERIQIFLESWGGEVVKTLATDVPITAQNYIWNIPETFEGDSFQVEIIRPNGNSVQSDIFSIVAKVSYFDS